jgi:hypothetical protein
MLRSTVVSNVIALGAGTVVAWGLASFGLDALRSPEIGLAALILTIFGTGWIR